jgi:hypothetical protein
VVAAKNLPGGAGFQAVADLFSEARSVTQPVSHRYLSWAPTATVVPPTAVSHGSAPGYWIFVGSWASPLAKLTVMPSTAARSSTPSQALIMLFGTGM